MESIWAVKQAQCLWGPGEAGWWANSQGIIAMSLWSVASVNNCRGAAPDVISGLGWVTF